MGDFDNAWVIDNRHPLKCHLINYDSSEPVYLVKGEEFPRYNLEDYNFNDFRLSDKPTEEYIEKHPECLLKDNGQMTIFDFMEE